MNFEPIPKTSTECPKCKGTGIVKDPGGEVHTCWDCLNSGKLDAHSKDVPDSDVKI